MGWGGGYYPLSLESLGGNTPFTLPPPSYTPAWMADIETNSPSKIPLGKKFKKKPYLCNIWGRKSSREEGEKKGKGNERGERKFEQSYGIGTNVSDHFFLHFFCQYTYRKP